MSTRKLAKQINISRWSTQPILRKDLAWKSKKKTKEPKQTNLQKNKFANWMLKRIAAKKIPKNAFSQMISILILTAWIITECGLTVERRCFSSEN